MIASGQRPITPEGEDPTTFGFDALGRIRSRTTPAATETYAFVGLSETVHSIDDGTTVIESAIDAAGARLAITDGTTTGFALFDLHGSLAAVSDGTADVGSSTSR